MWDGFFAVHFLYILFLLFFPKYLTLISPREMSQYLLKILLFMWDVFFAVHLPALMYPSTYVHKITYVLGSRLKFGNMFLFSKV